MQYDFRDIERRWQEYWATHQTFRALNPGDEGFDPRAPKFYVLDMFPYPSGVGLHVGHPLGYIATDIVARHKRMQGRNVLHPMGYDAFGLPAEQFAVEHGVHPRITTEKNIANMTRQLKRLGLSYDWDRALATTDPGYYKWTQWIFLQLYNSYYDPVVNRARPIKELVRALESERAYVGIDGQPVTDPISKGLDAIVGTPIGARKWYELSPREKRDFLDDQRLAYMAEVEVNWCAALGTVLANEEVTNDNRSERGNHPVFKRPLRQWMLRITAYADRLEDDLELVEWPEPIKMMQRNWIGRSEGAEVEFEIAEDAKPQAAERQGHSSAPDSAETITVFTTRPDTLFGATYMVLAPEHSLVPEITTSEQRVAVNDYRKQAAAKTDEERQAEAIGGAKSGVFTGAFAINPVNGEKIPIWIADYVMMGYGTGAIMAVPGHDQRDLEFAKQFGLPVNLVVMPLKTSQAMPPECWPYFNKRWGAKESYGIPWFKRKNGITTTEIVDGLIKAGVDRAAVIEVEQLTPELVAAHILIPLDDDKWHEIADAIQVVFDKTFQGSWGNKAALEEEGVACNSANEEITLNDLPTADAKRVITEWLHKNALGRPRVQYKLRDWLFSRQRYWGEPFPILHGPDGETVAVDESELPVELPEMADFRPTTGGAGDDPNQAPQPPLGRAPESWRKIVRNGVTYTRELNTMPQWAGSCWYYLRFLDPANNERFVGEAAEKYWMVSAKRSGGTHSGGVDLYVGGAEHAVLHLLYSRFWHKVLFDLGHVSTPEPFGRLFNQGYIQAYSYVDTRGINVEAEKVEERGGKFFYEGEEVTRQMGKMGKSLKNAVAPDEIAEQYGCDTLRLYEMYLGPLDQSKIWRTQDIIGVHRFLQRVWRNFVQEETGKLLVVDTPAPEPLRRLLHKTIKRVTEAMNNLSFNVAIAALIELNNELVGKGDLPREVAETMTLLLSPMAPHIAEELWSKLGHTKTLAREPWPTFDPALLVEDQIEYPVQVNGKLRGRIVAPSDADEKAVERLVLADEKVKALLDGKTVRKVIVVKGRLVNLVVG